jgi:hypothetical protein
MILNLSKFWATLPKEVRYYWPDLDLMVQEYADFVLDRLRKNGAVGTWHIFDYGSSLWRSFLTMKTRSMGLDLETGKPYRE